MKKKFNNKVKGVDIYEKITNQIIQELEKGVVPWNMPWLTGNTLPLNFVSKKEYRGINSFMLNMKKYDSPNWLTFNQIKTLNGKVKKGEKSTMIIFFKPIEILEKNINTGELENKEIPMIKHYNVFNILQTDLTDDYEPIIYGDHEKIERCENVIINMKNKPRIEHIFENAFYRPSEDLVNSPEINKFSSQEEYYSILFHELVHSTGHETRLNREGVMQNTGFGSQTYSKEELIAEMGASFLSGFTGISNKTIENSAAYINSWLTVLKGDKKILIQAAAQAQKAADYILI